MEICEKIMTPYAPRSLKVIGTDRDRSAAHEFLLVVIHSNHGLSRTVSMQDKRENRKFFPPAPRTCVYNARAEVVLLEFYNGGSV